MNNHKAQHAGHHVRVASSSDLPSDRALLPKSNNYSSTYLHRPRRSASFQEYDPYSVTESERATAYNRDIGKSPNNTSIRQSPPPVTRTGAMPSGALLSPPDSTQNSSDDETPSPSAGRNVEGMEELEAAVYRSFDKTTGKHGSPSEEPSSPANGEESNKDLTISIPGTPPRLSASARKISHSRSATESSFFDIKNLPSVSVSNTSSDDSDEELDASMPKPPLLRKKSGELVKPAIRPPSRRKHSSMPGTPTYSKAVHFNEDIEQVRHFLQVDRPIAVSAGTSPVETYEEESEFPFAGRGRRDEVDWEIKLMNFPRETLERQTLPIHVDSIKLSPDQKSLLGACAVANLAFTKHVVARFTLDHWNTTSEVVAEYSNDVRQGPRVDGFDQFSFSIKLADQANLESKTMLLCVRYTVNGQEYWDNNESMNYQIDFAKTPKARVEPKSSPSASRLGARPIPRSRHNSGSYQRPRSMPSFDDDFASSLDTSSLLQFRNKSPAEKPIVPDTPPPRKPHHAGQPFASRYDFGASLTQALSQAQAQLGDRSGLPKRSITPPATLPPPVNQNLARSGIAAPSNSGTESPRPDTLLATKQTLDSRAYQEFVSKFCFFGSNKPSPGMINSPNRQQNGPGGTSDGTNDVSQTGHQEPRYTYTNEQMNKVMQTHSGSYFYPSDDRQVLMPSMQMNEPSNPPSAMSTVIAAQRSGSPVAFGYPYVREQSPMFVSEPHTPQAIQG